MEKVPLEFFTRDDTLEIAQDLLGKIIVVPDSKGIRVSGKIVETEAYLGPKDRASHAYENRRTKRTEVMFREGGAVYVFFVYGMYYQLNVVTAKQDVPHAILIRAVEPLEGIDVMRGRRGEMPDENLTSGPGKLSISLGIDNSFNGENFCGNRVWIERGATNLEYDIQSGKRIGIDYAEEDAKQPWRFWLNKNQYVSKFLR